MPLISIVIPVFNEEDNVRDAYNAVCGVIEKLESKYKVEILFSDNHSTDNTFSILSEIATSDTRVKVLRYNRNYGFQRSLMTAYRHASGDAAFQLDCDLQDPPELLLEFLKYWEKGHDVVVGLRFNRPEGKLLSWCRHLFYSFLDHISEDKITRDAGDFRLVDRSILNQLKALNEQTPYVRGLISSIASNEIGIPYKRETRKQGESKYPLRKLIGFALNGIFGHSMLPLRLAVYVGVVVSLVTLLLSLFYIIGVVFFGSDWPTGFATTAVLILLGISLNGIFMGVIGEYLARIYMQVRQRPLTVVEQAINFSTQEDTK